jgi:hypothetical protein
LRDAVVPVMTILPITPGAKTRTVAETWEIGLSL